MHHKILEGSIPGDERGLLDVLLSHSDLMVSRVEIQLREVPRSTQSVHELFDSWKGVSVLDCYFVQSPVVDAHAPFPVFLRNEEHRGAIWA